jgi:ABC-2 type transport system permease protein
MSTASQVAPALSTAPPRTRESCKTSLLGDVRSEAIRLMRPGFLGIGLLVVVLVTALITVGTFYGATSSDNSDSVELLARLENPGGIIEAVKGANTFLGIVLVSWAAVAVAGDYSTGIIRLLVQAEPRRWRLMVGKLIVLAGLAIVAAALACVVTIVASPIMASARDVSTAKWGADSISPIATTFVNLTLGLLVWGALGFMIAVLTRSVPAAIAGIIAFVLVIESVLILIFSGLEGWLPGGAIQAVVDDGNDMMSYGKALVLVFVYAAAAVLIGIAAFQRRDITA